MKCLRFPWMASLSLASLVAACGETTTPSPDASTGNDATPGQNDALPHGDATPDAGVGDGGPDAGPADVGPLRSIVFLHTNDEHSHHLGFGPEVDDFPTPATGVHDLEGGLLRRAKVLADLRAAAAGVSSPVAVVGAGDIMMGSLFHLANPSRGFDYVIAALLGYDALTLGNHEFDFGVSSLASALANGGLAQGSIVQVPILTSNIRFSMSSPADDALMALYSPTGDATHPLRRTHIKQFGNVRVGFIGLMGLDAALVAPFKTPVRFSLATTTATCSADAHCSGSVCLPTAALPTASTGHCAATIDETPTRAHFAALVADAASAVAELRQADVDLVVALCHVGVDERELATLEQMGQGPENAVRSEEVLLALGVNAALSNLQLRGLDVIVGGHSHTMLEDPVVIPNGPGKPPTLIVQSGSYGRYVGKLRLVEATAGVWEMDPDFTGLESVDDAVVVQDLEPFTRQTLEGAIMQVIQGLESVPAAKAGDDTIFPGEQCDGARLPNNGLCAGAPGLNPPATGGTLGCATNRQLNLSQCTFGFANCGNGTADGTEHCDGTDLRAQTCVSLGYEGGSLACHANCAYNFSGCTPFFPSMLEIAVNFGENGFPIRDTSTVTGDLFFYTFGRTNFDLPDPPLSMESNLLNFVTDAERFAANLLVPAFAAEPVRVTFSANGVIRDGLYEGRTGKLTMEDLFRVLPLGVSPIEETPGYGLVDFYMDVQQLVAGLEVGVGNGILSDSFWLGASGIKVEYDLSRPVFDPAHTSTTGRVMKVTLVDVNAAPWNDGQLESTPIFDRSAGNPFPQGMRKIHVATSLYLALFMESMGLCPWDGSGGNANQLPQCRPCTNQSQCTAGGGTCNLTLGRCVAPIPGVMLRRTLVPPYGQELKDFLTLPTYVRGLPNTILPSNYREAVPRRLCCVGSACPPSGARTCQ